MIRLFFYGGVTGLLFVSTIGLLIGSMVGTGRFWMAAICGILR